MFKETYYGLEIRLVKTFGLITVYEQPQYRTLHCNRYVAFHENGLALKEFKTKREAFKWAQKQDGKFKFQINTGFGKDPYKISAFGGNPAKLIVAPNFPMLLKRIKSNMGIKLEQIILSFQPED